MKVFLLVFGLVALHASLLEASKNAGPTSNRSSNRNGGGQRGGGGGWGTTGDSSYRGRREVDEEEPEEIRQKRSFAPGAPSVPSVPSPEQGSSQQGGWGVSVNKEKGTGPQIRTEAQGNIYKGGNVRVDGQGHHEFGKGRKPSFGGSIRGRWRREAEEEPEEMTQAEDLPQVREKRQYNFMPRTQPQQTPHFPQPKPGDRGSVGVTINRDQGRGPQIRTEAEGRIFTSRDGNWRVDGNGYHEAGRGRKPDYGVGVKVQGRFRRDVDFDTRTIRKPGKLTFPIETTGPVQPVQPLQPVLDTEEVHLGIETRNKRSPQDRGSVSVSVNKDQGRGPQVRTDAQGNIYTSRDGNWRVDGNGYHEAGRGRKPDYGVGVKVQGRFRREVEDDEALDEQIEEEDMGVSGRDKRAIRFNPVRPIRPTGPFRPTGPVRPIGPVRPTGPVRPIRPIKPVVPHRRERRDAEDELTEGTEEVRFRREVEDETQDEQIEEEDLEVSGRDKRAIRKPTRPIRPTGPVKPIRPIKPVRPHRRERRDAEDELTATLTEGTEEVEVETREKRSPKDRGSVSVSVNKDQGRGPQVRTDAQYNIYKKNNWEVNSHANHEFGRGRKPSYGGGISVSKRFRREIEEEDEDEQIEEVAEREKRSPDGPKIIKTVYIRPVKPKKVIYRKVRDIENEEPIEQEDESETIEKRSISRVPRPDVLINRPVHRPYPRFRRDADDDLPDEPVETEVRERRSPQDRGSVNVSVNRDQGRGPQVRTDAQYQIYKKNNWEVNSHANHEFGRGRKPSYGGGISVTKRF